MRLWKKTGISIFPLPLWLSSNLNIFDRSILGAASRIGDSFRFEINISPRWNARWKGGVERWRSGRIKEKRVLRIETKRALLLGTLIFIVAEVCARFLQSHTLSTLASPSFTIPATSLETTIFPRPSKTLSLFLISRNETSNFFRPLHLLSLSVPAETADKMASRDVSFVLVSPPTFAKSLYEFLRLARPIYRYSRETAKQVPPPILSPFERLPPPIKPRELLFSRPVSTAVVLWPKYRCGLNIFLLSPPHRDFFYISQTFYNRKGYCWKGISFSIDRGIVTGITFFLPLSFNDIARFSPSRFFERTGLFQVYSCVCRE